MKNDSPNHYDSLLKLTIFRQTLIFTTWLKHSASCGEENHCNSLLKWTKIHQTLIFVSRLKHVHRETIVIPRSKWTKGHLQLGATFRESRGEKPWPPTFALATEIHRAIDLSCRACDACGAMAMGAGLGFPVGDSAPLRFHPQPPITSEIWRIWNMVENDESIVVGKSLVFQLKYNNSET